MYKINTCELISEFLSSSMSVVQFCKVKNISTSSFYKHKKLFETNDFIDITNIVNKPNNNFTSSLNISLGKVIINVDDNTNFDLLRKVINELSVW